MKKDKNYIKVPVSSLKAIIQPIYVEMRIQEHLTRVRTLERTTFTQFGVFTMILN